MRYSRNLPRLFFCLLVLTFLAGCSKNDGESLPLQAYTDPQGRYSLSIPQGWSADVEDERLLLTPPDYSGSVEELRVVILVSGTGSQDVQTHVEESQALIESFLKDYLDESYEVVNEGETRIMRRPTVLLDFAKPYQDSYLLGREVILAAPSQLVIFLGTGFEADWQAFLPTFREMLSQFQLLELADDQA